MAAKLEVSIFYNEEIDQCEITWSADRTADFSPMEKATLEQLKTALINQLSSVSRHGQLH
ncbi:hypothetical protein SAMN05421579_14622 [Xenorhabdus japonica]|uniref:Uncharacterized protein n=2 Tax=Xenorhabdus japonica TaxID=53341 RepID=A0A1I5DUC6_9GAMM|nr:hypothetical protein SAMN05421579_14622 [Xenorhabdus japonica]